MPMGPPNIAAGIVPSYEQLRALATAPDTPPVLRTRVLDMLRRNREGREARPVAEQAGLAKAIPDGLAGVQMQPEVGLTDQAPQTDWGNPPNAWTNTDLMPAAPDPNVGMTGAERMQPEDELRRKNRLFRDWVSGIPGAIGDYLYGPGSKEAEGKGSVEVGTDPRVEAAWGGLGQQPSQTFPLTLSDYEAPQSTTEAHYADATTAGAMPMWAAADGMPNFPAMPEMPEPKGIAAAAPATKADLPPATDPKLATEGWERPPEQAAGLDGMTDWQYGLLAAGLGILGADPRKGLLGAIGEGGMAMLNGMQARRAETRADQRYAQERADRREEHEWAREDRTLDRQMRQDEFNQRMTADAAEREDRWRLAQYNAQMDVWAKKIGVGLDYARLANEAAYRNQSLDLDRQRLGIMKAQAEAPTGLSKQFADMADYFNQRGMPRGQAEQKAMEFLQPKLMNPYGGMLPQDQGLDDATLSRFGAPVG